MPACECPHAWPQPGGKRGLRGIQKAKDCLGLAREMPDCQEMAQGTAPEDPGRNSCRSRQDPP